MASFHYLAWTNTLAFGPTMTVFRQHRRKKSVTKSLHPHQPVGTAAMRKASKSQPPLEEGKCRQRSPSPPHRRLRSQHSSESAARTCHPCAMRYDFVGWHENLESRPRPRPPRRRASVTWRRRDTATRRRRTRAACCSTSGPASNSPGSHPRMLARRFCGAVRSRPLQGPSAPSTR